MKRSTGIAVVRNPVTFEKDGRPVALTIGNFDGVHLGHQAVLKCLVAAAKSAGGRAVVISFYPHPGVVLGKADSIPLITPLRQKAHLMQELGVDVLVLLRFTKKIAELSATEFLDRYARKLIGAAHVVLGPDTALGKNRAGNKEFMLEYFGHHGIGTQVVPFLETGPVRISSRGVRDQIAAGSVDQASFMLGRPYRLEGRVLHGEARGGKIGFPTANIVSHKQVLPKYGVYATRIYVDGNVHNAVTNIGVRPTFGGGVPVIESHLLGFSGSLYGKRIEVEVIARLRDERKFSGIGALKDQIGRDIEAARKLLGGL